MPSMEGEADLDFASSISGILLIGGWIVCPQMTQIFADGGNSKNRLLNPMCLAGHCLGRFHWTQEPPL